MSLFVARSKTIYVIVVYNKENIDMFRVLFAFLVVFVSTVVAQDWCVYTVKIDSGDWTSEDDYHYIDLLEASAEKTIIKSECREEFGPTYPYTFHIDNGAPGKVWGLANNPHFLSVNCDWVHTGLETNHAIGLNITNHDLEPIQIYSSEDSRLNSVNFATRIVDSEELNMYFWHVKAAVLGIVEHPTEIRFNFLLEGGFI